MKREGFADRLSFYSGSFTLDIYTQTLRRFLRFTLLNTSLGSIIDAPISSDLFNSNPLALLLGESNRLVKRYPLIHDLVHSYNISNHLFSPQLLRSSYFKYIYSSYCQEPYIRKLAGLKNSYEKTTRVLRLNHFYISNSFSFVGVRSYLERSSLSASSYDYPLTIKLSSINHPFSYLQLDGSHRRSLALYHGYESVPSLCLEFRDIKLLALSTEDTYIRHFWPQFESFLKETHLFNFD